SVILFTIVFTTILVFTVEKTKVKDFYASFFSDHVLEDPDEESKANDAKNIKPDEDLPPPTQIV
ncbi:MAG: hypothetical protein KAJ48_09590, partial [Elusimicrobiales bacterium]|nr:hypothetical protein [Elusimicrobiales bacterium]